MNDPAILFIKPKAISQRDKKTLQAAGVIVVEVEDVNSVKFVRPHAEMSTTEILNAAMVAVSKSSNALDAFGRAMNFALLSKRPTDTGSVT
jgi:hypothetical protein